jgi:LPS sulfotransferase NodH
MPEKWGLGRRVTRQCFDFFEMRVAERCLYMTVFVLFSQQRSGTGALTSYISAHPTIVNLTEVLNPNNVDQQDCFFRFWLDNDPLDLIRRQVSPSDLFVDYLAAVERRYAGKDVLLDIKLNSIRHVLNYWEELPGFGPTGMPWLVNLFHRRQYPIVYLHRGNHLKRFVSSKVAELTGVYHTHDPAAVRHAKIHIDLAEMMTFIIKAEASHDHFVKFTSGFERRLLLTYETLFTDNRISPVPKSEIGGFFGFDVETNKEPYYVKLGAPRLDRVLMNYQEVKAELKRTGRGHYAQGADATMREAPAVLSDALAR